MRSLLLSSFALLAVACAPKNPETAPAEVPVSADATNAQGDAAKGDAGACDAYAKSLCGIAGEQSETCNAIKTVVGGLLPSAACEAGAKDLDFTKSKLEGLKEVCKTLADKLCKDLGETTKSCEMVKTQTPTFPPDRCQSLMQNYDAVLADLQRMEARNKPLSDELKAKMLAGAPAQAGSADSKVKVVEFSDFECPFCSKAADALNQLKAHFGDKIHVVFRNYPLEFHKAAHLAHQASLEALAQGKFWQFHDLLFKNQKALARPDLEKYAGEVGLDMAKFKKALDEGTYKAAVDADIALGGKVGVDGTPTLFINGERAQNPGDFEALKTQIEGILSGAAPAAPAAAPAAKP
jgi:protein-disulfide isomerase